LKILACHDLLGHDFTVSQVTTSE